MKNKMIHTPEGVRDIYGEELRNKLYIKNILHEKMNLYGYNDIATPTFEYFDIYNDVGTSPSKELYKFFDKEGNILALRSDFTPSIARCSAKYFLEDSMPVRLCYEGNSFTNNSDLQGKLKETTELGAELIDESGDTSSDAEMICLTIDLLKTAGLKDFQVSIGQIEYFKALCDEIRLSVDDFETLRNYISLKNYFGAREFLESLNVNEKIISNLLDVSNLNNIDALKALKSNVSNERAVKAIEKLEEIYEIIKLSGYEKYVSFDLGLINKFHYYTGVIFRAYTYGVGDAVIKGGRYDNLLSKFGKNSKAIGFAVLIDDLLTALKQQELLPDTSLDVTYVVYTKENSAKALGRINELRNNGKIAASFLKSDSKSEEDYREYAKKNDVANIEFFL